MTDALHPDMAAYIAVLNLRDRPATAHTLTIILTLFQRWADAEHLDPVTISSADLLRYQEYLITTYRSPAGQPLARATISARISSLKGWYGWLVDRHRIVADPSRLLGVRYTPSRVVLKDHLSLQEATALLQTQARSVLAQKPGSISRATDLRDLAALSLVLATGRRIGGLAALTVAQVDLDRRELRVEREKGITGRVLPVASWAMDVVAIYLRESRPTLTRGHDTPWLFLSLSGTAPMPYRALRGVLDELMVRVVAENPDLDELPGKRISWHSLRVSFATMLFGNGCDIRSVNELLLHRGLTTTAKYTPVPVDDLRQVFRAAHPRP
jgi:site-specific recombinase XerD